MNEGVFFNSESPDFFPPNNTKGREEKLLKKAVQEYGSKSSRPVKKKSLSCSELPDFLPPPPSHAESSRNILLGIRITFFLPLDPICGSGGEGKRGETLDMKDTAAKMDGGERDPSKSPSLASSGEIFYFPPSFFF